ncbi:glycoside hydrolase family 47 protein [Thozetella sp. PMI_491]|nr:glycoside hydrolase family 47 protein [Thozetella sp. PMI_491]
MAVMYRPFRGLRSRHLVLAIVGVVVLYHFLISSPLDPPLESLRLEQVMNSRSASASALKSNNSFDWSKVEYRYPPGKLRPLPSGAPLSLPRVQADFGPESSAAKRTREARRDEVRKLFIKNWESYRKYAWGKDALQPLTAGFKDQFSGWAATLVDSLDTLWIMGLRKEFDEAVEAVASIDFGRSSSPNVNMFETTIRYLGGLLAAYDLSKRKVLLTKAIELGDMLYAGFDTEHRMPVDFINFALAKESVGLAVEGSVVSASPGTLSMEMTHLSQITGDPKYYDAVARVMDLFYSGQNETRIPGMWPMYVSMAARDVVSGGTFTIGGCADSLYEYLPKMHALTGGLEPKYMEMSRAFMRAADRSLFFRPMLPDNPDILISGNADVTPEGAASLDPESEHLSCFTGGLFALAGRLFQQPGDVDLGDKLARGCIYAYKAMPTGMMPERYNMVACESREHCPWDEKIWATERALRPEWKPHLPKGFTTAKDPRYILRPEAIESVFVLYRVTGRQEFQEAAWDMFTAVANGTWTEYANAAVLDVTKKAQKLPQEDYMESFWLAETLKYFYLAFSPPDVISLDEYVLNTEAHPFRRPTRQDAAPRPL